MKSFPNCRAAIGRVGQVAKVAVLAAFTALFAGVSGQPPSLWAQSGPTHPSEPTSRVLAYVPAQKGKEAHVVFVPPLRQFKRAQQFRLQTPRGEVLVHCEIPRFFPEPKPPASEAKNYHMKFDHEENIYYFKSPSLPIYLLFPYQGYAGEALSEARVNGATVRGGNYREGVTPHEVSTPIVLRGKKNKLSLIMSNSGGE